MLPGMLDLTAPWPADPRLHNTPATGRHPSITAIQLGLETSRYWVIWRLEQHLHNAAIGNAKVGLSEAMRVTAEAITQCKFEATDPSADEVVLYNILQV